MLTRRLHQAGETAKFGSDSLGPDRLLWKHTAALPLTVHRGIPAPPTINAVLSFFPSIEGSDVKHPPRMHLPGVGGNMCEFHRGTPKAEPRQQRPQGGTMMISTEFCTHMECCVCAR